MHKSINVCALYVTKYKEKTKGYFFILMHFLMCSLHSLSRKCVKTDIGVREEVPGSSTCVTCSVGVNLCRLTKHLDFLTQASMWHWCMLTE